MRISQQLALNIRSVVRRHLRDPADLGARISPFDVFKKARTTTHARAEKYGVWCCAPAAGRSWRGCARARAPDMVSAVR